MQVYKAIKYIRLSYTDDKTVESDSVANQRRLIDDYIARHPEIEVVAEKIDDGYSGVLFDRPAFQEGLLQCFPNKRRLEYINGPAYFRRSKIYRYLCNWQEKGKRDWQPTYTVKG